MEEKNKYENEREIKKELLIEKIIAETELSSEYNKSKKVINTEEYISIENLMHHINNTLCPMRLATDFIKKEIENELKLEILRNKNISSRDLEKYRERKREISFFIEVINNLSDYIKNSSNFYESKKNNKTIIEEKTNITSNKKNLKEVYLEDYVLIEDLKFNFKNNIAHLLNEYNSIKKGFGEYSSVKLEKSKEYIEDGLKRLIIYHIDPKYYENKNQINLDKLTKKQNKYLKTIEEIID